MKPVLRKLQAFGSFFVGPTKLRIPCTLVSTLDISRYYSDKFSSLRVWGWMWIMIAASPLWRPATSCRDYLHKLMSNTHACFHAIARALKFMWRHGKCRLSILVAYTRGGCRLCMYKGCQGKTRFYHSAWMVSLASRATLFHSSDIRRSTFQPSGTL